MIVGYKEALNTGSVFGINKRGTDCADRRTCVETVCRHPPMKENVDELRPAFFKACVVECFEMS